MSRPRARLVALLGVGCLLAACSENPSIGEGSAGPPETTAVAPPPASVRYEFELITAGDGERQELAAPVPVGRTAAISVSLSSQGEAIDVGLEATVTAAAADGSSQIIDLVVVSLDAEDAATIEGLTPILDASSTVLRDGRLAVVEQVLDVPAGLSFRSDAVARQSLRAPFALMGPVAVQAVGSGAEWTVSTFEDDLVVEKREVSLELGPAGYAITFDVPGGTVELSGQAGALLPDEQVITLDDAVLIVAAERIG